MHVCSVLVYVSGAEGALARVCDELNAMPGCEATPDESGKNVLILVTETEDDASSKALTEQLDAISDVECIALVFGGSDQMGVAS